MAARIKSKIVRVESSTPTDEKWVYLNREKVNVHGLPTAAWRQVVDHGKIIHPLQLIMPFNVLIWLIWASVLSIGSSLEEVTSVEVESQPPAREGRFFFGSGITGINKISFRDESGERVKDLKSRVDSLLMKIADFEKLRAKLSDAEKLLKLIEKLSNICPPNTNSLRVGNKCFEHVTTHWMDYDSAFVYCKARGGALAAPELHNDKYLDHLRETFPSLGDNSVMVGVTDIQQEGRFTFQNGTLITPRRFFGGKFPSNPDKDCVSLIYAGGFGITDTKCKRLHEVLCEYDVVSLVKKVSPL